MMEATGRLCGGLAPEICSRSRDYFRDVYDHLARINAAIDTIRETIATAIQVNLSMVTIEESEVNKKLAAWAGIFAMAAAFAGIWGMNFKAMPELQWEYGYPTAMGVRLPDGAVGDRGNLRRALSSLPPCRLVVTRDDCRPAPRPGSTA